MPKLTKRVIDALEPGKADLFAWDNELRGFGVRMKPSGSASWLVQYRNSAGQSKRFTIGQTNVLAPDEARKEARRLLSEASSGKDPAAAKKAAREALTVEQLCAQYLEAAQAGLVLTRSGAAKRVSTVRADEGRINQHIVPLIGKVLVRDLNRAAVQRMVDAIAAGRTAKRVRKGPHALARVTGGPATASRTVGLLGGILSWGARRGLAPEVNPAHGVEKAKDKPRDRVLTHAELSALGEALRYKSSQAAQALKLIALTGARRQEIVNLRWSEIDENWMLRLTGTKTGTSVRPLASKARRILYALSADREGSEFVFPNKRGTGSADLEKSIGRLFNSAGLTDARSHDLRRTYASIAAELGYSNSTIGELLGHARRGVTSRHYIRHVDATLIKAADRVSGFVANLLTR